MPPLESTQRLGIGTPCPEFALVDTVSGKTVRSGDFADRPLLLQHPRGHVAELHGRHAPFAQPLGQLDVEEP